MKNLGNHFLLSAATFFLMACMALPSVVKLAHALHGHMDRACSEDVALHFHQSEFDCAFQKFKVSIYFYSTPRPLILFVPRQVNKQYFSEYSFLSEYQQLHFSLRGPPAVS